MREQILKAMKDSIQIVLDGKEKSISIVGVYPNDVKSFIEETGGKEDEDSFEPNGWQWDFWMYFTINSKQYVL